MVRVLVVDDDPDFRLVARLALERDGSFDIADEAADASQAVERAVACSPDVILLDCTMPGSDPLAAVVELRAAAPAAAIVLASGHSPADLRLACRALGAVGFLPKETPPARLAGDLRLLAGLVTALQSAAGPAGTARPVQPEEQVPAASAGEGDAGGNEASGQAIVLEASPASVRAARRFVSESVLAAALPDIADAIVLATSELVTNAVVHAGTEVTLIVRMSGDAVRVEVTDRCEDLPEQRPQELLEVSGRGLSIVQSVASRWGIDPVADGGKTVWFEMARDPALHDDP